MADLDAMLDDAAEETLPSVIDVDAILKSTKKIDAVKPWLAFSSNVPPAIRDKWSKMVKTDALAKRSSELQPSNVYYEWESTSPLAGPDKLLQEVMREAATESGFDEVTTAKLLNHANPMVEPEGAKELQSAYRDMLVKDLAATVKSDPNYSAEKYPKLASKMKALGV